jgi:hypothetical protein
MNKESQKTSEPTFQGICCALYSLNNAHVTTEHKAVKLAHCIPTPTNNQFSASSGLPIPHDTIKSATVLCMMTTLAYMHL